MTVFALAFVGLTAITGPIQQAQADGFLPTPLCGLGWGSAGPVTATTVNYGGKLFDIIGYNKDDNKVGVAGDANNSVTLLLDKEEVYSNSKWNDTFITPPPPYQDSTISKAMNVFANSTLTTNDRIVERTLTGGSDSWDYPNTPADYNPDYVAGPNVLNQKAWPLSTDEASHLILSTRVFSSEWWLRTPGYETQGTTILANDPGFIHSNHSIYHYHSLAVRPALYLDMTSDVFSGITFNSQLPIGSCQAEYINPGIDYTDETITGIDTTFQGWKIGTTYAGLGEFVQQSASATSITDSISSSPSSLVFVKASDDNDHFDSDKDRNNQAQESLATTINIPARPTAPVLSVVGEIINNVTTNMEYNATAANYDGTWTAIARTTLSGLPDGTYYIRDKAVAGPTGHFKSFAATAEIIRIPETTPTLALDYTNETITGFDTSTSGFMITGTEAGLAGASCNQLATGTNDIASTITNSSKTLWTKKCATDGNHSDSTTTSIVIPARPVAPTISATAPTLYGLGDGFVGGLTTNEEYNTTSATYDGAWTPVTGTSVDSLSAGDKVCVRTVAEVGVKFKSLGSCVTVGQGVALVSSVNVTPNAITLTAGQTKQLSVTVLPVYADNKQFNCSSSNSVIASATRQSTNVCKITTKTAGTVTIKATTLDGSGVFGTSVITVKPKPVSTKAKKAKGSITFIWGGSGFLTTVEIYYRVKGSSKWKVVRVSGADRKKIKLKRKKTYQFQLRGCKTVKGKNYYSAWTKKTIKS
jgi:hypothetical protein